MSKELDRSGIEHDKEKTRDGISNYGDGGPVSGGMMPDRRRRTRATRDRRPR
jgi:hypothetical protein